MRKLLLTKAMADNPSTHPYRILSPACKAGSRSADEAEACLSRLRARLDASISADEIALNSSASFRSPLASRAPLFAQPFVFNVECAALT